MAKNELSTMTRKQLEALKDKIENALRDMDVRNKEAARKAAEAKAKEFGFSLNDLVGKPKPKRARKPVAPKYRHPENAEVTWSGRGHQPRWIKEGLASGKGLEDYLIR